MSISKLIYPAIAVFLLTSCGGSSDVSDTSENNDSILIVTDSANSEETQNENSNLATNSTTPDDGIASDGESVQTENGNSNETSAEGSDGSDISENNNSTPIANSSSSSEETQNEDDNLATDGTAPDDGIASDEEPVQTENGNNNDTSTDAIDDEDESTSNDSANVNPSSPDENRNLIARLTPGGDRQLNEAVRWVFVSADGRIVAFDTFANNLVEQDNNDFSDVFIHNTDTNELSGLTLGFENAADTSTFSRVSAITPDGRYVVFASNATNITADGNSGILQLYRHDRETGTNVLVSRSLTGAEGNDASFDAQISADGNTIVFRSSASNLIDGESFERSHVYVHTVQNGETVNITSQLSPFNTNSEGQFLPVAFDMTADGQYIFLRGTTPDTVLFNRFTNQSTDLESMFPVNARNFGISDDARYLTYEDPSQEIFWVDLLTGITESVSRGILPSGRPAISSNGQYVAFEARRTVGTFMSLPGEVYVRDIFAAQTTLVTQGFDGSAANNLSPLLDVAFTGNNLVFRSSGSNLVEGDDNGKIDAFIYRIE